MCFSAKANFIVGSVIGVAGLLSMYKTRGSKYVYMAATPAIFAIQQFLEGVVWLHMDPDFISTAWSRFSLYGYLFFALLFWPVWIPIATLIPEKSQKSRIVCYAALVIGLSVAFVDLLYLYEYPITPIQDGHNLNYGEAVYYMRVLYGLAILLPLFASSIRHMWIMGLLILLSFILSNIIYNISFTSVWCFFAAALSFVLYFILPKTNNGYLR